MMPLNEKKKLWGLTLGMWVQVAFLSLVTGFVVLLVGGLVGCQDDAPPVQKVYPHITVDDPIEVGDVNVGYYQNHAFEIRNEGTAALQLESISLIADDSDSLNYFELMDPPTGTITVGGGAAFEVTVRFSAFEAGTLEGALLVVSDDQDSPALEVALKARGVLARIETDPDTIEFGAVDVGESATEKLTIRNAGEGKLKILSLYYENLSEEEFGTPRLPSDFRLGDFIVPGYPIEVAIDYSPLDGESDDGNLVIESDDPANPRIRVPLSGNGVPNLPPQVTLILPSNGDTVYIGAGITLSGIITDNKDSLDDIRVVFDSTVQGTLCSNEAVIRDYATDGVSCSAELTEVGEHTIRMLATDSDSNTSTAQVTVTVWDEETPLTYAISGSSSTSIYAFYVDDNMVIEVIDATTGTVTPCLADLDNTATTHSPQACEAKFGDTIAVRIYDRYGPGLAIPQLYLWYGAHDEWNQVIIPETIVAEYDDRIPFNPECEPTVTSYEWSQAHPDGELGPDCEIYSAEIVIAIPPPEAATE